MPIDNSGFFIAYRATIMELKGLIHSNWSNWSDDEVIEAPKLLKPETLERIGWQQEYNRRFLLRPASCAPIDIGLLRPVE